MSGKLLKFWYPLLGLLLLYNAYTSYANGEFGEAPDETLVPRDVSKNPGTFRPGVHTGGVFIFHGK